MTNSQIEVLPAVMPDSFATLERASEMIASFASWAQLDVMDARFVPSRSWPYTAVDSEQEISKHELPYAPNFEIHLMVKEPRGVGEAFARAGARRIIVHTEATGDVAATKKILGALKEAGASEVGVSLLLDTAIDDVYTLVEDGAVDVVQVMSIAEIGFQGHAFDVRTFPRIQDLRARFPELSISVDGGVSQINAKELVSAGATRLGVGSAIMKTPDPTAAYHAIINAIAP